MQESSPVTSSQPHVLVVEDDPSTLHALELLLRHHRYQVTVATTVAEAIRRLDGEPDAILLDLMLPDGDGMRVLETVRARRLSSRVTIITGVGDTARLDEVRALAPDLMLQKPVDFSQILQRLPRVA